jgi:hypothetical protein
VGVCAIVVGVASVGSTRAVAVGVAGRNDVELADVAPTDVALTNAEPTGSGFAVMTCSETFGRCLVGKIVVARPGAVIAVTGGADCA